jgi:hypothetical protein
MCTSSYQLCINSFSCPSDQILYNGTYLLALTKEVASHYPLGTNKPGVDPIFLENICTPAITNASQISMYCASTVWKRTMVYLHQYSDVYIQITYQSSIIRHTTIFLIPSFSFSGFYVFLYFTFNLRSYVQMCRMNGCVTVHARVHTHTCKV